MREALRVATVLTLGALMGAIALSVLLLVLANLDARRPLLTDVSLSRTFWQTLAFCLFTVPIAWLAGVPLYVLFRRLGLLRVWICALTGGAVAVAVPNAFRLIGFGVSLSSWGIFWLLGSGTIAGVLVGLVLRRHPKALMANAQTSRR